MLSKFKSKLFSARGVFGGGDKEEEAPPPSAEGDGTDVGVAVSRDITTITPEGEWYVITYNVCV